MNKNYADTLESYMIAEEGLFSKLKDKFKKKKDDNSNKNSGSDNSYNFSINADKALQDSRLDMTPYPANKYDDDSLKDAIEKDLKIALSKVLSCQEVMNAIKEFCEEYNNTPKDEVEDRFNFIDVPQKISPNWFKTQFSVYYDGEYYEICDGDQNFRSFYAIEIIEILAKYLKKKYANYNLPINTGDGDEGCIYIDR